MNPYLTDPESIEQSQNILAHFNLCNACLVRQFARLQPGLTNEQRGKHLKKQLQHTTKTPTTSCWLCEGLINEIPHFTQLITKTLQNYTLEITFA